LINFSSGPNLPDGGLWYTETDPSHLIVEPFNAASAMIFIFIAGWWLGTLKGKFVERSFLFISSIILMIGAVGGSIYHAFRYSAFFLYMDWVPILMLCLMASTYFLYHIIKRFWLAIIIMIGVVALQIVVWNAGNTRGHYNINVNYAMMASSVLFPLLLFMRIKKFRDWYIVLGALCAFLCALFFRIVDGDKWISIGTHFLWHLFGALACHLMFLYIYRSYHPAEDTSVSFRKSSKYKPATHA
jgi:hypothetical protein